MTRMTVDVHADDDWRAVASPAQNAIAVTFRCPRCTRDSEIRLQLGPWSHPSNVEAHERFAGANGHLEQGFADYERTRAAGELPHTEDSQLETQLWCHGCGTGADVTVNT